MKLPNLIHFKPCEILSQIEEHEALIKYNCVKIDNHCNYCVSYYSIPSIGNWSDLFDSCWDCSLMGYLLEYPCIQSFVSDDCLCIANGKLSEEREVLCSYRNINGNSLENFYLITVGLNNSSTQLFSFSIPSEAISPILLHFNQITSENLNECVQYLCNYIKFKWQSRMLGDDIIIVNSEFRNSSNYAIAS